MLTEHIGHNTIDHSKTDREIHDEDVAWLRESDIVIAEVTTPSFGVRYEIGRAVEMNKRILCLYRNRDGNNVSAMIKGSPDFNCYSYQSIEEAKKMLSGFIRE